MPRIDPASAAAPEEIDAVLRSQELRYGRPLFNHLVLARCPQIFTGFRAMWDGIDDCGLMPPALLSLLNLRVASLIGCGL